LAEFGTTQTGGSREEQSVIAVTLDWLLESCPAPSLLKIDVEGAELEVLKGAQRVFETARPILLCEMIPESAAAVTKFLSFYDYRIFNGETPSNEREALPQAPWSTIAIPY
jgi:Methyltransferase FkbM domain